MKVVSKNTLQRYYNYQAACQVLGSIMNDASIIKRKEYPLDIDDFMGETHRSVFICVNNLSSNGLKEINIADIESYLSANDPKSHALIFNDEDNLAWLSEIYEDANIINFEYYYTLTRKMSLLRSYLKEGIDVGFLLDMDEIDHIIIKEQQERFEILSLMEIQKIFDRKNINAKQRFNTREEGASRKAGDEASELREKLKGSPSYGLNLESKFLNTIARGALEKKFFLETRDSGMGKTRAAMKRLVDICSPYIWSFEENDFIPNPNGQDNAGLYIGTEMEIYEELEPMIWAFISGVEEYRILRNILTPEEEERVDRAVEISKDTKIFLEDEENYDLTFLWNTVEKYSNDYNIRVVAIDYLELTSALTSEYVMLTKGMGVREDQVLLNLSANVKNMAKRFNLTFFGFTQTTDEARRDGVRDQRAVKGARSLPNKADVGITVFEPTNKEMELIEPYIQKSNGLGRNLKPNVCYTIYKNRGGEIKNVKIWCHQNLGNMKIVDLFCTDNNYEPISIDKTYIDFLN